MERNWSRLLLLDPRPLHSRHDGSVHADIDQRPTPGMSAIVGNIKSLTSD